MRVSTDRHEPRHNSALPVPEPCSSPGEGRKAKLSWRLLFSFTNKRHLGVLFPALASTVVVAATRILLSVILGKIFNYISQYSQGLRTGNSTLAEVSTWCIVLAGLGGGSWVANSSFLGFWIAFGEFQASEARKQVFASILLKRSQWFSSLSDGIEGLHTRIHTQIRDIQLATSQVLGFIFCDAVTTCASLVVALYFSWRLALVLLATLPVSFVILALVARNLDSAVWKQKQYLQKASTLAAAAFNGIDLVTVFGGCDTEVSKYASALRLAARHFLAQVQSNSIQRGYVAFWSISIFVLGFWYGLVLVQQGTSPGNIITTFHAILTAFQCAESFARHWLILSKGKGAGHFLANLARLEPTFDDHSGEDVENPVDECNGDVRLDKVSFSYQSNPSKGSLREVSLHFPANKMSFLVGASGSGKSTVCALIADLLAPTDGQVLLDGCSIRELPESYLRTHVALVHQTSPVIHDTFFNNVALGDSYPSDVTASEVLEACKFAQLESTILNLHGGLSTLLTPDDHLLSGGQRQRLALARAWLRDPTVLIMDEPTSALDPTNQVTIMKAIREWRQGKTTIIVTHDFSNIEDQDFVHVMKNGSVFRKGQMQNLRASMENLSDPKAEGRVADGPVAMDNSVSTSAIRRPPRGGLFQTYEEHRISVVSIRNSVFQKPSTGPETWHDINLGATQTDSQNIALRPIRSNRRRVTGDSNAMRAGNQVQMEGRAVTGASTKHFGGALRRRPISLFGIISMLWPSITGRNRVALIVAIPMCLAAGAATPAFSYCLARLINVMWTKADKNEGTRWALYLLGIAAGDGLCTGGAHYLFDAVGQHWVDNLRVKAFRKVLQQPRSWFQATHTTSAQVNQCLDRNAQEMRSIVGRMLPVAIVVLAITFGSVTWAMFISWRLTLVTLSPLPLIIGAVRAYSKVGSRWEQRCNDTASNVSSIQKEMLLNFDFIKVFGLESYYGTKHYSAATAALDTGVRRSLRTGPLFGLYQAISLPLSALVFYYGTSIVARGPGVKVDEILQVINLLLFSVGMSFELLNNLPELAAAKEAAAELLWYVQIPEAPPQPGYSENQPCSPLPVRIRNLEFAPDAFSPRILSGFSFDIEPSRSLAMVGASGSGKSTALSLLLGLNVPNSVFANQPKLWSFEMSFGHVPQPIIDMKLLRSKMAYVPQRPFLFPGTIAENIAYGIHPKPAQHLPDSVIEAAKASGIHEFIISLPNGYDTVVGDGGQALSGGQAQLVNIARAMARKPQLLILDEPTSALDVDSAAAVRSAIRCLIQSSYGQKAGMAIVVATHSIEMMKAVDEIVVLHAGTKVEQGTFSVLTAKRGPFWQLVTHSAE